jgi:hypothetical protein
VVLAPLVGSVTELRRLVCDVASKFDAGCLDGTAAAEAVQQWSAIVHAADAAMALAAARLSACELPASAGARDAADLVAKATGTTGPKAKALITRGCGLAVQAKTRRAATSGELSPDQTGAITDAVSVNPAAEDDLLAAAGRSSVGELRQQCAQRKAEKQDLEEIERDIHARRCLRRWRDAEGAEHLHARGTKQDMAVIDQALKQLVDRRFKAAHTAGQREPLEAYGFDAAVDLAAAFLDGDTSGARRDPIRNLTVLRIDLSALVRGKVASGETCEIAGLGPIAVATAREMLGESVLKLVVTDGVDVRNVTHLGRGPNTAQKIALLWEQPMCEREGCGRRARLESDHVEGFEYRTTRHTRLDELSHLCDPDHDLKTLHGWALIEGTGVRPMVPPDDPRHPGHKRGRAP